VWGAEAVKLVTFVPEDDVEAVAAAMARAGAGSIGRYAGCSFRSPGVGTFVAPEDADPAVGRAGETNAEAEIRLEMVVPGGGRDRVVAAMIAAHPYEEPAFDVYERRGDAGCVGRLGHLANPTPLSHLARLVEGRLGGVVRWAGASDHPVRRIAVVPGSGADLIDVAVSAGADVLVTGDVSHHRARAALERGMAVVDPGHVATERPGLERLYAAVSEIAGTAVDLRELDPDPWRAP
jgi:hypothetical protein